MKKGFLCFLLLISYQWAQASLTKADLFEQKTNRANKLFTLEVVREDKEAQTLSKAIYKDLKGQVVVEETGILKGSDLLQFDVKQLQTNEQGSIKVENNQFIFTHTLPDGTVKTSVEKAKGKLVTAANFNTFIKENISALTQGDEIDIRFGVWFRRETVGFTFKKMKTGEIRGQKAIQFRMKPSSFVIAAIVDPLYMWYTEDGSQLLELDGRVPPKIQKNGQWKDLDAEVVYNL